MLQFDTLQTFYVDPAAVNNSSEVLLSSIELFFKSKPDITKNVSGTYQPGVTVSICNVENDQPILTALTSSRVEYNKIYSMTDASVATVFSFDSPIVMKSGNFYGIILQTEDLGFELWTNKQGDKILGTNTPSSGSGNIHDGKYYRGVNGAIDSTLKAISDTDLKFKVNIAKYIANTISVELVNKDYEFLTYSSHTGAFLGGEFIYQNVANSTGTLAISKGNTTIIGTGTSFNSLQVGKYIAALNGTGVNILEIQGIVNTTVIEVTQLPTFSNTAASYKLPPVGNQYYVDNIKKKIHLVHSSANSTNTFGAGNTIIGEISGAQATIVSVDDLQVDHFVPKVSIDTPSRGQVNITYALAYSNGSAYIMPTLYDNLLAGQVNEVTKYNGVIRSRSNEVLSPYLYSNTYKSSVTVLNMSIDKPTTSLYSAPLINSNEIDFFIRKNMVSNTYTSITGGVTYDTEVNKNGGQALAKHISKKVNFANNRFAEDVRVYLTGYRPLGTAINVYCKLHNSADTDSFDDKSWTPLLITDNAGRYSSSSDSTDLIEFTYALPHYSETANTLPGSFTTQLSNNILGASGVDPSVYVSGNSAVKIYNPLIPDNYMIAIVASSNSSSITLTTPVSNNNIVGNGFYVDKLKYPNIAFNDPLNYNISTYFNSYYAQFNKFNSMQVKIVLLADNTNLIPKVDKIEVLGVSA